MTDPREYLISVQRRKTEDGVMFEGTVAELPDIAFYADNSDEAYDGVVEAIAGLQYLFEEQGRPFPPPQEKEYEYSGKFLVRIPKHLHRSLAQTAGNDGVSLNQYVLSVLSCHSSVNRRIAETHVPTMPVPAITQAGSLTTGAIAASADVVVAIVNVHDDPETVIHESYAPSVSIPVIHYVRRDTVQ